MLQHVVAYSSSIGIKQGDVIVNYRYDVYCQ